MSVRSLMRFVSSFQGSGTLFALIMHSFEKERKNVGMGGPFWVVKVTKKAQVLRI